jgi:hypothetical protein
MKAVVRRWFGDVETFEGQELPHIGDTLTLASGDRTLVERCDLGKSPVIFVRLAPPPAPLPQLAF